MKTIEVSIKAELSIPEEWEIVEHCPDPAYPDERVTVLKIRDNFYDFFPECLMKIKTDEKVFWSADEGQTEDIIDCMDRFTVQISEKK
ncbi:hypothetical protein [Desulfospira joergensenii]|uniref:hypothetical protein n=1 Tax=Desulfospira joergensenii TaxID=53329 RepID=UPI000419CB12|nr:hypothetical protein [Desulfospira joergensenii]